MNDKTTEKQFQNHILESLLAGGAWQKGESAHYDRKRAIYTEDLLAFVKETQAQAWEKYTTLVAKNPEEQFLNKVEEILSKVGEQPSNEMMRKYGTLGILRHPFKTKGAEFRLCAFMPDHELNPDTIANYKKNRFRVVPELTYSAHIDGKEENSLMWRIDLVFFINGIPIVTIELKSDFKQDVLDAIQQYKQNRQARDPITKKEEPLLKFKRGTIVHFAVSQTEVFMTTKLEGENTYFLPFNKGTSEGGAGNDTPKQGYATSYLWEEILQPDNLLKIIGRFVHLKIEEKEDYQGRRYKKESLIFPRYHQWDVVNKLMTAVRKEGSGHPYLIQHSAGSGKSNSIAWLTHQLASLYKAEGKKYFQTVIVITDRTILDAQLQDTIYQFEHVEGMIKRINMEEGGGSKSEKLKNALEKETPVIIVTIQTFPFVIDEIRKSTTLAGKSFAIVADEAHSSQTGRTATKVKEVLLSEKMANEEQTISAEDMIELTLRAKAGKGSISYFAFTATPKDRTIQLFGRVPENSTDDLKQAFHVYTMKQAIEEGFILDVLYNYLNYKEAYQLRLKNPEAYDDEVEKNKGSKEIRKWVKIHPTVVSQKIEIIIEHFRENVMQNLSGQAKAMVVTDSRLNAVKYKLEFDKYIKEKRYDNIRALVAFSGEVHHVSLPDPNKQYTESNMNPHLKGRDIRKAFDSEDFSVLIVANKFQTGFDQPKLCAMYVDKVLAGIECVQTLSRLNRTYPNKTKREVYVLDFVNTSEEIQNAFQPYYKNVTLTKLSEPDEVYDLQNKLDSSGYYTQNQVQEFVEFYFDKTKNNDDLIRICQPSVDKWATEYKEFIEQIRDINFEIKKAKKSGDTVGEENLKAKMKEYEKGIAELELFKRELGVFSRYYEFISQIFPLNDSDLEKLSLFARNLQGLLKARGSFETLDLSGLEMKNYRLSQIQKAQIKMENEDGEIDPTSVRPGEAKEKEKVWLSELIARLNEAFDGDFGDTENLEHSYMVVRRVIQNQTAVDQIKYNDEDQILYGDLPGIVDDAIMDIENVNENKKDLYLGNKEVREKYIRIIYAFVKKLIEVDKLDHLSLENFLKMI